MTSTNPAHWLATRRQPAPRGNRAEPYGPSAVLVGAIAVGGAVWLYWGGTLAADALLPAVCALFVILAAAVALTWPRSTRDTAGLTYWDAAGILLLIGVCAAAAVEPDQMVRLVEGNRQP